MRIILSLSLIASLVAAAGCPGPSAPTGTGGAAAIEFDYILPTEVIVLEPEKPKEVPIKREGKGEMKAADLKVEPSHGSIKATGGKFAAGEKETKITLTADKDAPTDKEHTVAVKAGDKEKTFKVKVQKPMQ